MTRISLTLAVSSVCSAALGQGLALEFTRHSQATVVPSCPPLQITQAITMEAWIKPMPSVEDPIFKFILSKNYGGTGFAMVMVGRGNEQRIQLETNGVAVYGINEGFDIRQVHGLWIHVAGVSDGSRQTLYLNGIPVAQSPALPIIPNNMPLQIGGSPWGSFSGAIDEVRIWSVARTQAQILRDKDRHLTGREPGLVGYWDFDRSRGRTFANLAGLTPDALMGFGWKTPEHADFWQSGASAAAKDLPRRVQGRAVSREH